MRFHILRAETSLVVHAYASTTEVSWVIHCCFFLPFQACNCYDFAFESDLSPTGLMPMLVNEALS